MVSLSQAVGTSFARQLDEIAATWQHAWSPTDPDACFSRWATSAAGLTVPFPMVDGGAWGALPDGRWDEAPILAAAGFRIAERNVELVDTWTKGMGRLVQRDPFPVDRQSFFFRPVELLGVALGAAAVRDTTPHYANWIDDVLQRGEERMADDIFSRALGALARHAVSGDARWTAVGGDLPLFEVAFLLWAAAAFPGIAWSRVDHRDLEVELVRQVAVAGIDVRDAASAAIAWAGVRLAVSRVVDATIATAAAGDVVAGIVSICRRFPLVVRELRRRHSDRSPLLVSDEYDVQDLLRALLSLHFDDVQPEAWTPAYAGTHSRMDFLLPAERVVIEAKMTRERLGQREIVDQLTIDRDHYRAHPGCDRLVCLVYDPDGRLPNPVAIERDLSADQPLPTTVIVAPRGI